MKAKQVEEPVVVWASEDFLLRHARKKLTFPVLGRHLITDFSVIPREHIGFYPYIVNEQVISPIELITVLSNQDFRREWLLTQLKRQRSKVAPIRIATLEHLSPLKLGALNRPAYLEACAVFASSK